MVPDMSSDSSVYCNCIAIKIEVLGKLHQMGGRYLYLLLLNKEIQCLKGEVGKRERRCNIRS